MEENNQENVKGTGFGGKYIRLPRIFREKLSKPMPTVAIQTHPTKSYLSTIKAIYVTERLNDVFGVGGWDFEHEVVSITENTTYNKDNEVTKKVPYVVVCGRIYLREFDLYSPYQYGGHEIDDRGTDPADGYKSAVTDAMGKCASLFEIGIQVFKGIPKDQTANKSKRLDPNEKEAQKTIEEPTSILGGNDKSEPKSSMPSSDESDAVPASERMKSVPKYEPVDEPVDASSEPVEEQEEDGGDDGLRERYKELYGRYPNKNWKDDTIAEKIKSKEVEGEEDDVDEEDVPQMPSPEPVMDIEEEEVVVDEGEAESEEEEEFDFDDKEGGEENSVPTSKKTLKQHKEEVDSFLDANELKEEAKAIIFEAQMDDLSESEIKELKEYINNTYKKLIG